MRVGYTKWARQTIDSEVFYSKPDKWFKIWFYIVNRVNFLDTDQYQRGECFLLTQEICEATKASPDQIKKFLKWARGNDMLLTERSTRGIRIKVIKYNTYQDSDTYKSTREAPEKHQRSTPIGEEGKKVRNTSEAKASQEKNMFNSKSDDYEEGFIDLDGDGELKEEKAPRKVKYPNAPAVRKIFQEILGRNPANWRQHTTQLQACENLSTERTLEKVRIALKFYKENEDNKFIPKINTPHDLDTKWLKLGDFKNKQK